MELKQESPQKARVKRSYPVVERLTVQQVILSSQDIGDWQSAINAARSRTNPQRRRLQELYQNMALDGHLESVMERRANAIINKRVVFHEKGSEGEFNQAVFDSILDQPWFRAFQEEWTTHVGYGPGAIELIPRAGKVHEVLGVPRANYRPEFNMVLFNAMDPSTGIDIVEDPLYSKYFVQVGNRKRYGKLMTAAQYVIYKRGGLADWSQFAELFGMPFREATYPSWDPESRKMVESSLKDMGGAGYIVLPDGAKLTFHDMNKSGKAEVYSELVKMCNDELSKIFLGNTLTTSNDGGGTRSLGEVQAGMEEDLLLADILYNEYTLNHELKPRLLAMGYPVGNGRFAHDLSTEIPQEKLVEIAVKVAQQVPIAPEWWYETFNIERPKDAEIKLKEGDDNEDETEEGDEPKPGAPPGPPPPTEKKRLRPE